MVSRLEILLLVAIVFFVLTGLDADIVSQHKTSQTQNKEMELVATRFYEANQSDLLTTITTKKLVKYPDRVEFIDFKLQNNELTLIADRAVEQNRVIQLDHNSTIIKSDGTRYQTRDAKYYKDKRVLEITGMFAVKNRFGDINGSDMKYQLDKKEVGGHGIKAKYEIE